MDNFPTVGLSEFDEWFKSLWIHMVVNNFISLEDILTLDREHWKMYFDYGYTYLEAFEEDLTCYAD